MTSPPTGGPPGSFEDDGVLLTSRQRRQAERDQRRQAKDAQYELRLERKRARDGTSWQGRHIVDGRGLADAFPAPQSPEFSSDSVRRRIIHGATLVLLLALLVAGVVVAGLIQRGDLQLPTRSPDPPPAPPSCPAETMEYAPNNTVTVNVYNGGSLEGAAGKVAEELRNRGFVINEVANAPAPLSAPAIVVSGPAGHAAALSLQRQFAGSDFVQDERADAVVDVVITRAFTAVLPVPEVNDAPGALSCPHLSPPPSDPAKPADPPR